MRVEISEHDEIDGIESFDGYSRFWCKQAVLGVYWIAESIEQAKVRIHLTEDIELEGFQEALSFQPDLEFKKELLTRCDWEEVVQQIFPRNPPGQLSLFEGIDDE